MIEKITGRRPDKKSVAYLVGLFLSTSSFLAAHADDSADPQLRSLTAQPTNEQAIVDQSKAGDAITTPEMPITVSPPTSSADAATAKQKPHQNIAHRIARFTSGVVVNTPLEILRTSKEETINDTLELVGDKKNPLLVGAAGALSLPFGITSGLFEGTARSLSDSWKQHSVNSPAPVETIH